MGKLKLCLILAVTVALCGMTGVYGQESGPAHTVAEETLQVDASSATVLQWFHRIELEKRIVLSYNASLIDLNRVIRVEKARRMTVPNCWRWCSTDMCSRRTSSRRASW